MKNVILLIGILCFVSVTGTKTGSGWASWDAFDLLSTTRLPRSSSSNNNGSNNIQKHPLEESKSWELHLKRQGQAYNGPSSNNGHRKLSGAQWYGNEDEAPNGDDKDKFEMPFEVKHKNQKKHIPFAGGDTTHGMMIDAGSVSIIINSNCDDLLRGESMKHNPGSVCDGTNRFILPANHEIHVIQWAIENKFLTLHIIERRTSIFAPNTQQH